MQCGILPYAGVDICLFELLKDGLLQRYDGEPPHIAICHTNCLPACLPLQCGVLPNAGVDTWFFELLAHTMTCL